MADKRQINGRAIINDLRSGMADWELQVKYKLPSQALLSLSCNTGDWSRVG
jgi:hypothetical protein